MIVQINSATEPKISQAYKKFHFHPCEYLFLEWISKLKKKLTSSFIYV